MCRFVKTIEHFNRQIRVLENIKTKEKEPLLYQIYKKRFSHETNEHQHVLKKRNNVWISFVRSRHTLTNGPISTDLKLLVYIFKLLTSLQ